MSMGFALLLILKSFAVTLVVRETPSLSIQPQKNRARNFKLKANYISIFSGIKPSMDALKP